MLQKDKSQEKGTVKVKDLMIKEVIQIDENASVKEAADIMNHHEIGSIVAVRKRKATGILTERDLLKRIVSEGKNAEKTRVKEVMSTPLVTIPPDTDLEDAARLMFEKKIKKLPVVSENHLLGLISLTDIARCQPRIIRLLQCLSKVQAAPKNIEKVLYCYIV
jgi:CBS domain-containing protein